MAATDYSRREAMPVDLAAMLMGTTPPAGGFFPITTEPLGPLLDGTDDSCAAHECGISSSSPISIGIPRKTDFLAYNSKCRRNETFPVPNPKKPIFPLPSVIKLPSAGPPCICTALGNSVQPSNSDSNIPHISSLLTSDGAKRDSITTNGPGIHRNAFRRSRSPSPVEVAQSVCDKIETSDGEEEDEDIDSPPSPEDDHGIELLAPLNDSHISPVPWSPSLSQSGHSYLTSTVFGLSPRPPERSASTGSLLSSLATTTVTEKGGLRSPGSACFTLGPTGRILPSRRRVVFADDLGHQLFDIRVIREPTDVPPVIENKTARALIEEQLSPDDLVDRGRMATWELHFAQPASEYVSFRNKINSQNVCLENVVLRNRIPCRLKGTIKVKNLSFEKKVFLRLTDNNWISYRDTAAQYERGSSFCESIYDTFTFDLEIPPDSDDHQRLEFCVCYHVLGSEYWDSNQGRNYVLLGEQVRKLWDPSPIPELSSIPTGRDQLTGAAQVGDFNNWTEFCAWEHLNNKGPYW